MRTVIEYVLLLVLIAFAVTQLSGLINSGKERTLNQISAGLEKTFK